MYSIETESLTGLKYNETDCPFAFNVLTENMEFVRNNEQKIW